MRLCTLICLSFFALTANSQTKDAEFKKLEALIKKSAGLSVQGSKLVDQELSEKSFRLEFTEGGKTKTIVFSNLNWDGFDYSIKKANDKDEAGQVELTFEKEMNIVFYENKKQVDKMKQDKMVLFFNRADSSLVQQQLEELVLYTDKNLNEVRMMNHSQMISFLTKELNKGLEAEKAKIKSMDPCEITIAVNNKLWTLPMKKLSLHSIKFLSEDYVFCYGKEKAEIKVTENAAVRTAYVEHPKLKLTFENLDKVDPINYAIGQLAQLCSLSFELD